MRVFRTSYTDRKGRTKEAQKWYIELRDHLQKVRRFPAFVDKQQSEVLGRQVERLISCKVAGGPPTPELTRWLEGTPQTLRNRLAKIGLLDPERVFGGKLLSEHLADFKQFLSDTGDTIEQVELSVGRAKRIIEDCRFTVWADMSANTVSRYINDLRNRGGLSKRTANHYLRSIKHFCLWMVKQRRASESPLAHLDCVSVEAGDIRHGRRALSVDEIRRLLETTATQPERFGMTGPERVIVYRLAVETGLRRNELRSLTRASFDFDKCMVTVEAQHTKNGKEAVLPLRADTVAELKQFVAGKLLTAGVFSLPGKTAMMVRADLEAAGIAYVDDAGRFADFHSLRHTTGTLLASVGVHPKVAQTLMRHSDINLTMSRYTHTLTGQEAKAVESLPDLSAPSSRQQQRAVATGTDDKNVLAFCLAQADRQQPISLDNIGQLNPQSKANGRIRTDNPRFTKPELCH
jgi:integrase